MAANTEPIPGTSDLWDPDVRDWCQLESAARDVFPRYGYAELRTPVFERTKVFVRSIGDQTEVVQKEMYTFKDRGGRSLTLRPEGTAGVIRAIANRGLSQGEQVRVFYSGPMFRGERPAAGRKRQFHQIGVESVGLASPLEDAEVMAMQVHYLQAVGISDARLLINTRGVAEDRDAVSEAFRAYFAPRIDAMCDDCRRRLDTNVWRILDCKNEDCQGIVNGAPDMIDLVCDSTREFFQEVCTALDSLGVTYEVAPRLVRGLDYYVHTVFEVVHSGLGAQDAIAGGGRYRISLPGQKSPVDGVGFAAGMERLLMARESLGCKAQAGPGADVYVAAMGDDALKEGLAVAQQIRRSELNLTVLAEMVGRSMKAQMRTANKLDAALTLIIGDAEIDAGTVVCKNMKTSDQEEIPRESLLSWLEKAAAADTFTPRC